MIENTSQFFEESSGKLLSVQIGKQEYGIPILDAREVVGMIPIDAVPQTPQFMKGVINLRGTIIPVINLRGKFGMPEKEATKESCIIVVETEGKLMGIIVDCLCGVISLEAAQLEEKVDWGNNIKTDFIAGVAKLEGRVIMLLDIQKVLGNEELVQSYSTTNGTI